MHIRIVSVILIALTYNVMPAAATQSQTVSHPVDTLVQLNEVSVTAVKLGNSLDELPVTSTTIGMSEIVNDNIVNIKQVSEMAPNVYMPRYGSRMTSSIYVRGLGARIDQPVMGLTVDNLPILNKDNYDFDIADIERIEILRGPQSTLYGRNTMGGVINISTLSPMRYQGVRLMVEYGTYNTARVSASAYGKLRPDLAMSLGAGFYGTDGHYVNEFNGAKTDREKSYRVNWRTVWRPCRRITLDNAAAVSLTRQSGYPYESLATGVISYNDTCYYRRTGITDGLTLRYAGEQCTASAVTGFQYIDDDMTLDQDFLPQDYFTLKQRRHEWALTEDIVAKGRKNDYRWLGGVFAFYKRQNMRAPVTFKDYGINALIEHNVNNVNPTYPIRWDEREFVLGCRFVQPVYGVALYHTSSYSFGPLDVSAGLRVEYEHTSLQYHNTTNTSYTVYDAHTEPATVYDRRFINIDDAGDLSQSSWQLLPRFTLLYNIGRSNVYASASKGYKSGGYNTQMFSDVLQQQLMSYMGVSPKYEVDRIITYRPEKSWNYELGVHLDLLDGRLTGNAALFYIDCRDQQLTMFPDGTTTGRIMTNAGKTRSVGGELSVTYMPVRELILRASYGYTDARFVTFNDGRRDYHGKRVPYAPANTMYAGACYRLETPGVRFLDALVFDLSVCGVGRIYWDEANEVSQPFYALLNAEVRAEYGDVSLALWGDNMTRTSYDTFYFVSIGNAFVQRGQPGRYGATLRYNF